MEDIKQASTRKKTGMLIMLLVMPVLLFFVYKFSMDARFALEIFYPTAEQLCEPYNEDVYYVPELKAQKVSEDSILENIEILGDAHCLLHFVSEDQYAVEVFNGIYAAFEFFSDKEGLRVVSIYDSNAWKASLFGNTVRERHMAVEGKGEWVNIIADNSDIETWSKCKVFLDNVKGDIEGRVAVLIDKNRRIRGFYDTTDTEDTERLITELRVLYHEYKRTGDE